MKRHAKALVAAILAIFCLGASAAIALQTHVKGTDVDPSGTPNGFVSLAGLAVDASGGDLYAADSFGAADFSGAIDRFSNAGAFQNQISGTFSNPQDVAVDSTGGASDGNVYLADTGNNLIRAFDATGTPIASFDTDGVLDGSGIPAALNPDAAFSSPCGVAVDQATGNLYVADQGHNRIWVFDSEGAYLDRIADSVLQGPCGLAFDSTGDLYVRNANTTNVVKFDKIGATDFNYAGAVVDSNNATDVAVDTSNDHVLITNGSQVTEYDSSGSQVSSFGSFGNATGIAVDDANEKVYVAESGSLHVYGPLVTLPDVSTGGASNVQSESTTISGSVDPAAGPDASCSFEYGTSTAYGESAPCEPAGPFNAFQEVTAELSGLTPNATYHYRLSSNNGSGTAFGQDKTFSTTNAPEVNLVQATEVSATSARLRVVVRPNEAETSYRFEYGTTTAYGKSAPVPDGVFGPPREVTFADDSARYFLSDATQLISGLDPDTTYHYRVRVANSEGFELSGDRTFRTFPASVPAGLLNNRAYEMVSPPEKGGSDVQGNPFQTTIAADGNAITFASTGIFAGSRSQGIITNYLARRGADGWTTLGVSPNQPPGIDALPSPFSQSSYMGAYTPDLSKGIYFARMPLSGEPNIQTTQNLYRRNDLLSGAGPNPSEGAEYDLLSDSAAPLTINEQGFEAVRLALADSTPGLDSAIYESKNNLTQDAIDAGLDPTKTKLYEWSEGAQRLASVLPDGTPAVGYAGLGAMEECGPPQETLRTLSDDGSAVFFGSRPDCGPGALYLRLGHSATLKLNESERTGCPADPACGTGGATFGSASTDGSIAYFLSPEVLTDDAPNSNGQSQRLYKYEYKRPAGERLTYLAPANEVVDASEDGQYLYFSTYEGDLDPDVTFPSSGDRHLYVWHAGEIRAVGVGRHPGGGSSAGLTWRAYEKNFSITPDGRTVLFTSDSQETATLAGVNGTSSDAMRECPGAGVNFGGEGCAHQVYLYRFGADDVTCVGCESTGATPGPSTGLVGRPFGASIVVHFETELPRVGQSDLSISGQRTQTQMRAISDDGSRVFFTSFEPLVPLDTNGRADAYEYDATTGEVRLLSTGECNCDSVFVGASPSGDDAFFVTAQRLVGIDTDNSRDLYDARANGGLAAQNPVPPSQCQGDACQSPTGPPNDATPASSSFQGAGNVRKAPRAKKNRKHRKHKRRKHKQRKHAHKRHGHHRAGTAQTQPPTTTRSHG